MYFANIRATIYLEIKKEACREWMVSVPRSLVNSSVAERTECRRNEENIEIELSCNFLLMYRPRLIGNERLLEGYTSQTTETFDTKFFL